MTCWISFTFLWRKSLSCQWKKMYRLKHQISICFVFCFLLRHHRSFTREIISLLWFDFASFMPDFDNNRSCYSFCVLSVYFPNKRVFVENILHKAIYFQKWLKHFILESNKRRYFHRSSSMASKIFVQSSLTNRIKMSKFFIK